MNIAKALKVKNRLAGELKKLQEVYSRENSRRNDSVSTVDRAKLFLEMVNVGDKLASLKTKIAAASAPIVGKLVEMAEAKAFITYLNSVPTQEGPETTVVAYGSDVTKEYNWECHQNRVKIEELIKGGQKIIENLQDEVDEFNGRTIIDFE